jgi:4-hydroxy-tetrahydrodipicolinate reductase
MRILQVGLGPLGRRIAADLVARGLGRVVAAVDPHAEVAGRPLGALVAGAPHEPLVSAAVDAVGRDGIDCAVVATSSSVTACASTFRALLERGHAVVSTCEELFYPRLRHAALADELHELAARHGGRLLGTGVNPGFLMDTVPVFASAVCREVRAVRVERVQDASHRRIPFQKKIGVGLDPSEFAARVRDGSLRHVGLGESLHFIADRLGVRIDRWSEELEAILADRDLPSGLGPVRAGAGRGVRQIARGHVAGRCVIELDFIAAIAEPDPRDRVVIDGDPPIDLVWRGGVHGDTATSAIVLNCIRPLLAAPPGLHTMATIPLPSFAAPAGPRAP